MSQNPLEQWLQDRMVVDGAFICLNKNLSTSQNIILFNDPIAIIPVHLLDPEVKSKPLDDLLGSSLQYSSKHCKPIPPEFWDKYQASGKFLGEYFADYLVENKIWPDKNSAQSILYEAFNSDCYRDWKFVEGLKDIGPSSPNLLQDVRGLASKLTQERAQLLKEELRGEVIAFREGKPPFAYTEQEMKVIKGVSALYIERNPREVEFLYRVEQEGNRKDFFEGNIILTNKSDASKVLITPQTSPGVISVGRYYGGYQSDLTCLSTAERPVEYLDYFVADAFLATLGEELRHRMSTKLGSGGNPFSASMTDQEIALDLKTLREWEGLSNRWEDAPRPDIYWINWNKDPLTRSRVVPNEVFMDEAARAEKTLTPAEMQKIEAFQDIIAGVVTTRNGDHLSIHPLEKWSRFFSRLPLGDDGTKHGFHYGNAALGDVIRVLKSALTLPDYEAVQEKAKSGDQGDLYEEVQAKSQNMVTLLMGNQRSIAECDHEHPAIKLLEAMAPNMAKRWIEFTKAFEQKLLALQQSQGPIVSSDVPSSRAASAEHKGNPAEQAGKLLNDLGTLGVTQPCNATKTPPPLPGQTGKVLE